MSSPDWFYTVAFTIATGIGSFMVYKIFFHKPSDNNATHDTHKDYSTKASNTENTSTKTAQEQATRAVNTEHTPLLHKEVQHTAGHVATVANSQVQVQEPCAVCASHEITINQLTDEKVELEQLLARYTSQCSTLAAEVEQCKNTIERQNITIQRLNRGLLDAHQQLEVGTQHDPRVMHKRVVSVNNNVDKYIDSSYIPDDVSAVEEAVVYKGLQNTHVTTSLSSRDESDGDDDGDEDAMVPCASAASPAAVAAAAAAVVERQESITSLVKGNLYAAGHVGHALWDQECDMDDDGELDPQILQEILKTEGVRLSDIMDANLCVADGDDDGASCDSLADSLEEEPPQHQQARPADSERIVEVSIGNTQRTKQFWEQIALENTKESFLDFGSTTPRDAVDGALRRSRSVSSCDSLEDDVDRADNSDGRHEVHDSAVVGASVLCSDHVHSDPYYCDTSHQLSPTGHLTHHNTFRPLAVDESFNVSPNDHSSISVDRSASIEMRNDTADTPTSDEDSRLSSLFGASELQESTESQGWMDDAVQRNDITSTTSHT